MRKMKGTEGKGTTDDEKNEGSGRMVTSAMQFDLVKYHILPPAR